MSLASLLLDCDAKVYTESKFKSTAIHLVCANPRRRAHMKADSELKNLFERLFTAAATQMTPLCHYPADVDIEVDIAECRAPPATGQFLPSRAP